MATFSLISEPTDQTYMVDSLLFLTTALPIAAAEATRAERAAMEKRILECWI